VSAFIAENTQFLNDSGKPIVAGFLYIGTQNLDPKLNPIPIFSDRELTVVLANPQTLDADGRSTNKIWIPGRYSMKVEDSNNVQELQELDNGEDANAGNTLLINVSGTNIIKADASPAITALINAQIYSLTPVNTNTGATTLEIGTTPITAINLNGAALSGGELQADISTLLIHNSTRSVFDLQSVPSITFTTGDVKLTYKKIPDTGYVLADDGSIGNALSSASNRADEDTKNLFTLLWENMGEIECPVAPGGRGASAAVDFTANKNITIPLTLSHTIGVAGAGAGLTPRTLGGTVGEEIHSQSEAEIAAHLHTFVQASAGSAFGAGASGGNGPVTLNTSTTGSGISFNIMQPTTFMNVMIKL